MGTNDDVQLLPCRLGRSRGLKVSLRRDAQLSFASCPSHCPLCMLSLSDTIKVSGHAVVTVYLFALAAVAMHSE
eukprot:2908539-Amphidinium_carterae.1